MGPAISILLVSSFALAQGSQLAFTSLTEKQARQTISAMRVNGQVGGSFDFRVTSTDRQVVAEPVPPSSRAAMTSRPRRWRPAVIAAGTL